jgi:hypothetical protein
MTWTVTLDSGDREVVLPNGLRYQGAAEVVLSDAWYGQLSAGALASLMSASYAGGTASYAVTLAGGLMGVVLPGGLRYDSGNVVTLSDEQYSALTPASVQNLLSSVSVTVET